MMVLDDITEESLAAFQLAAFVNEGYVLMIVSTILGPADYSISVVRG